MWQALHPLVVCAHQSDQGCGMGMSCTWSSRRLCGTASGFWILEADEWRCSTRSSHKEGDGVGWRCSACLHGRFGRATGAAELFATTVGRREWWRPVAEIPATGMVCYGAVAFVGLRSVRFEVSSECKCAFFQTHSAQAAGARQCPMLATKQAGARGLLWAIRSPKGSRWRQFWTDGDSLRCAAWPCSGDAE